MLDAHLIEHLLQSEHEADIARAHRLLRLRAIQDRILAPYMGPKKKRKRKDAA